MKKQNPYTYETEAVGKGTQMSLIPMQNQRRKLTEENADQKHFRTKKLGKRNFEDQRQQKRGIEDNEKYSDRYK